MGLTGGVVQGDDIRSHMGGIPRESDPVPIIHVYVDLHLETLHGAGIIPASAPTSARSDRVSEFSKVPRLSVKAGDGIPTNF